MSAHPVLLDRPGTECAMSRSCVPVLGAGGFDQHHPIPTEFLEVMGITLVQILLLLCPTHHRRQHALIRYLYNSHLLGTDRAEWTVLQHFNSIERQYAYEAIAWLAEQNGGSMPPVRNWPAPAARAI